MPRILYTSKTIRRAILDLLCESHQRRVAIVAYVADGAHALLPRPKGLELYCWPQPGSTNPKELKLLRNKGVKIFFVEKLHMKVYWAAERGAVIASANLSSNSLGSGGLHEAGVFLDSSELDINKFLQNLSPQRMTLERLKAFAKKVAEYERPSQQTARRNFTFGEWMAMPRPEPWKLYWWDEYGSCVSKQAKRVAKEMYRLKEPFDVAYSRTPKCFRHDEWLLCFRKRTRTVSTLSWQTVDTVVKVKADDPVFEKEYPYQALQMWPRRRYQPPPFALDKRFVQAFKEAAQRFGIEKLGALEGKPLSTKFIDSLRSSYKVTK